MRCSSGQSGYTTRRSGCADLGCGRDWSMNLKAIWWIGPCSLVCGVLGALLAWWIQRQLEPSAAIVGWMVTLVGWFVSARLGERAQRRMFLHQMINDARNQLIAAMRIEQDWVGGVQQLG